MDKTAYLWKLIHGGKDEYYLSSSTSLWHVAFDFNLEGDIPVSSDFFPRAGDWTDGLRLAGNVYRLGFPDYEVEQSFNTQLMAHYSGFKGAYYYVGRGFPIAHADSPEPCRGVHEDPQE